MTDYQQILMLCKSGMGTNPIARTLGYKCVDSIAIFGISSIPIFRIEKDMVFSPFGKRYFLNVIEFSGLSVTG